MRCSVCGNGISGAWENDGSFRVSSTFNGWNTLTNGKPVISDTCENCGTTLREAVAVAANKIVADNKKRVRELADALKRSQDNEKEFQRKRKQDEIDFAAWKIEQEKKRGF